MLPNYFYNNNYTIVQTKDHVMIMTEMIHDVRIIRTGSNRSCVIASASLVWRFDRALGRRYARCRDNEYSPDATGADVAVVPYRGASDKLKVTERFTRTGPDTLLYKFTIEDPSTFTAPFSGELPFNRIDELIHEYACHEGNYALPGILAGARVEEQGKVEKKE